MSRFKVTNGYIKWCSNETPTGEAICYDKKPDNDIPAKYTSYIFYNMN